MKIDTESLWNPKSSKTYRNIINAFRPGMIVVVGEKCHKYTLEHPVENRFTILVPGDTFLILKHFYVKKHQNQWRVGYRSCVLYNGLVLELITYGLMSLDLDIINI